MAEGWDLGLFRLCRSVQEHWAGLQAFGVPSHCPSTDQVGMSSAENLASLTLGKAATEAGPGAVSALELVLQRGRAWEPQQESSKCGR